MRFAGVWKDRIEFGQFQQNVADFRQSLELPRETVFKCAVSVIAALPLSLPSSGESRGEGLISRSAPLPSPSPPKTGERAQSQV